MFFLHFKRYSIKVIEQTLENVTRNYWINNQLLSSQAILEIFPSQFLQNIKTATDVQNSRTILHFKALGV